MAFLSGQGISPARGLSSPVSAETDLLSEAALLSELLWSEIFLVVRAEVDRDCGAHRHACSDLTNSMVHDARMQSQDAAHMRVLPSTIATRNTVASIASIRSCAHQQNVAVAGAYGEQDRPAVETFGL